MSKRWFPICLVALVAVQAGTPGEARQKPAPPAGPRQPGDAEAEAERARRLSHLRRRLSSVQYDPASMLFGLLSSSASDIGLTQEQKDQVRSIERAARAARGRALQAELDLADLPDQEREKQTEPLRRRVAEVVAHADDLVMRGVMDEGQATRTRQIGWRIKGIDALATDPALADMLGLTRRQRAALKQAYSDAEETRKNAPPEVVTAGFSNYFDDPGTTEANRRAAAAYYAEADGLILGALTPRQRERYRKLLGKPVGQHSPPVGGIEKD